MFLLGTFQAPLEWTEDIARPLFNLPHRTVTAAVNLLRVNRYEIENNPSEAASHAAEGTLELVAVGVDVATTVVPAARPLSSTVRAEVAANRAARASSDEAARTTGEQVLRTEGQAARATSTALEMTDEPLVLRAKEIHRELAIAELQRRGRRATEAAIRRTMRGGTVSIVETQVEGRTFRIVTTNRAQFQTIIDEGGLALQSGEEFGSRITYVYYGRTRLTIHAEQLGLNDARIMGGTEGRVASSNPGCGRLCLPFMSEEFPRFRHLNPESIP